MSFDVSFVEFCDLLSISILQNFFCLRLLYERTRNLYSSFPVLYRLDFPFVHIRLTVKTSVVSIVHDPVKFSPRFCPRVTLATVVFLRFAVESSLALIRTGSASCTCASVPSISISWMVDDAILVIRTLCELGLVRRESLRFSPSAPVFELEDLWVFPRRVLTYTLLARCNFVAESWTDSSLWFPGVVVHLKLSFIVLVFFTISGVSVTSSDNFEMIYLSDYANDGRKVSTSSVSSITPAPASSSSVISVNLVSFFTLSFIYPVFLRRADVISLLSPRYRSRHLSSSLSRRTVIRPISSKHWSNV